MKEIIKTKDLKKYYYMGEEVVKALDGIDLTVYEGEFLAIVGHSGSGKSTLMNMLSCLDVPTSGEYNFNGTNIFSLNSNQLAKFRNKEVGCIFQKFNLLPKLDALNNVIVPSMYSDIPRTKRKQRAIDCLESVGLGDRIHHKPSELSGGQQQRVAIARCLMCDPNIILADEPTGNLDSKSGRQVMDIINELFSKGHTIVMITHDNSLAKEASRIIEMKDGKIISESVNDKEFYLKNNIKLKSLA